MPYRQTEQPVLDGEIYDFRGYAFGIFLTWFWLAFGQGLCNPRDSKGYLVEVVAATLLSAAIYLFAAWRFPNRVQKVAGNRLLFAVVCVLASCASFVLAIAPLTVVPFPLIVAAAVAIGPCAACVLCTSLSPLVYLSRKRLFLYVFGSAAISALACSMVLSLPHIWRVLVFAVLPTASMVCARYATSNSTSDALSNVSDASDAPIAGETLGLLRHPSERARMVLTFGICFAATSAVRGASLSGDVGVTGFWAGAHYAMLIDLVLFSIMAVAVAKKEQYSIVFVRLIYLLFVLVEVFCAIPGPLGFEDALPVHIAVSANRLFAIPLAAYCLVFDVRVNKDNPLAHVSFVWGVWAVFAACGWLLQNAIGSIGGIVDVEIYLIANALVRLACFLLVFSDTQLVRLLLGEKDGAGTDTEETSRKDSSRTPRLLTFKEAIDTLAQQHGLTEREAEIAFHLAKGRSNNYIADELVLSFHTVRAHVRNIYTKLDVHNRQDLLDLIEDTRHQGVNTAVSKEDIPSLA